MDYTTNYQLPVWAETDRILRTDFNDMTEKIETSFSSHDTALETMQANVDKKGNCQIYITSYVGAGQSGSSHSLSFTFPARPILVLVTRGNDLPRMLLMRDHRKAKSSHSSDVATVTWPNTGSGVSWYAASPAGQMDESGKSYYVFTLLDASF